MNGADIAVDQSEPLEEMVLRKLIIEKLPEAMQMLTDEERELIKKIYFENMSHRTLADIYDVSHTAIKKRKDKILIKIKEFCNCSGPIIEKQKFSTRNKSFPL